MLVDIVYPCDILICRRRVMVRNRGEIRGIIATCATLTVGTMKGSAVTWTATATRIACWACCLSTRRSPRRLPPAWRPRNIWDMLKMRTRSGMDIYIYMYATFFLFFPLIEVVVFCILIFDYMLEGFLMDQFVTFFYMHGKCKTEFLFWVESHES